jgi:hypothetical protein
MLMIGDSQKKPPAAVTGYFALIPLIVGIAMVGMSLSDIASMRRLEMRGLTASGTVVGELKQQMSQHDVYCPLVRFTATNGAVVQFKDSTCFQSPNHSPQGAQVNVRYIAEAPAESAAVDQGRSGYWSSAFTGLVGLLAITLAIQFIRGLRRARRAFQLKMAGQQGQGG